jgi:hypothetical protein
MPKKHRSAQSARLGGRLSWRLGRGCLCHLSRNAPSVAPGRTDSPPVTPARAPTPPARVAAPMVDCSCKSTNPLVSLDESSRRKPLFPSAVRRRQAA